MSPNSEVNLHPFMERPESVLDTYPAIRSLLERKVVKLKKVLETSVNGWREFETVIQYCGWTCALNFHWRFSKEFHIEAVKITTLAKAPRECEQYEI
jgi:hypothetical protein